MGEAPNPGIQVQVLPVAHQPGLQEVSEVIRGEVALGFIGVVVSTGPGGLGLKLPGDEGRARRDSGVLVVVNVIQQEENARMGGKKPQVPLCSQRVLVSRPLKDSEVGPWGRDCREGCLRVGSHH